MGRKNNFVIDDGFQTFTFSNADGEVISSFRVNPTDVNLMGKCEEVSAFLTEQQKKIEEGNNSISDIVSINAMLEEKVNYMFGYNASNTLFRPPLTATTVLPDGELFLSLVLDRVYEVIKPEVEKRRAAAVRAAEKYTAKYK